MALHALDSLLKVLTGKMDIKDDEKVERIIIDKSKVNIREYNRNSISELKKMDYIITKAFGYTFTGAVLKRLCIDEGYVLEYNNEIISCIFATHYGCFRVIGPFGTLPEYSGNGIGSMLLGYMLKIKKYDSYITRNVLYTFAANYHTKFYMKFDFQPRFLVYTMRFNMDKHFKYIPTNDNSMNLKIISKNDNQFIIDADKLCDSVYKGLRSTNEMKGILNNPDRAHVVGLYDNNVLHGYCFIGYSLCGNFPKGTINIKFGIAKNVSYLKMLLIQVIYFTKKINKKWIEYSVDVGRFNAFKMITNELKFEYDSKKPKIHMGRTNNTNDLYDDYNTFNSAVIGDWRFFNV